MNIENGKGKGKSERTEIGSTNEYGDEVAGGDGDEVVVGPGDGGGVRRSGHERGGLEARSHLAVGAGLEFGNWREKVYEGTKKKKKGRWRGEDDPGIESIAGFELSLS